MQDRRRSGLGGEFRRLLATVGVSGVGDGMRQTAFPLLTASVTRSPLAVAAVGVAQGLPWLLFSLPVGALVDRWDRRRVAVAVNALRAVLVAGLAAAVGLDAVSLPLLAAVAFALTTAEVVADNASQALLPAVVATEDLERANGQLFAAQNAAVQFAGPPLGGLLFALRHAVPFALDAASFAVAALLLRGIRRLPRTRAQPGQPRRLRSEIGEGLHFLATRPVLRGLAMVLFIGNVMIEGFYAVFVLFALHDVGVGPVGYGVLFAVFALGAVAGSALAPQVRSWVGDGPAILAGSALTGLPLLVLGLVPNVAVAGTALFITGAGEGVWQVLTASLRQALIPDRLLGRVLGVFRLTGRGAMFLGAALAGVLADTINLRAPAIAAGVAVPLTALALSRTLSTAAIRQARDDATTTPGQQPPTHA